MLLIINNMKYRRVSHFSVLMASSQVHFKINSQIPLLSWNSFLVNYLFGEQ